MPIDIHAKTILNKTKRRDPWFLDDYTLNPFSGCSFNCLYCYIRGSKYGEHMEQKLGVKVNTLELLEKQLHLRAKKKQYGIIVLASATDPYLQFEKDLKLTRQILELILKHRFPLHLITKSDLVLRDLDLVQQIAVEAILPADLQGRLEQQAFVSFTYTTLDDQVAHIFEPGATPPSVRLKTQNEVLRAGLVSGVSLMPLLPYITDTGENLQAMYKTFRGLGVDYLFAATLTLFGNLPSDSKTLVLRAVEKHYPHLLKKYQAFFETNTQMPKYYQHAFYAKTQALGREYGIRNTITLGV